MQTSKFIVAEIDIVEDFPSTGTYCTWMASWDREAFALYSKEPNFM
jgi:hypothetical protein